jgi:DNA invertase Pin-like site-specific DNA recombinase
MKVAIYARVSTKDQTAENQLIELRRFANSHEFQIVDEYVDVVSGSKSEADRPAFKRMMADAYQHRFNILLFWSLDRFSREGTVKTIHYLDQLESYGVHFRSQTEQYIDSSGMFKHVIISLLSTLAKQEKVRHLERVNAGIARAKVKGTKSGKPFGRKGLDEQLRKQIQALKAQNLSDRAIGRQLGISHRSVAKYLFEPLSLVQH